jgi:hypothetical protein
MSTSILEGQSRTDDKVPHGFRDQDFAGSGPRRYTRPDVHGDPHQTISAALALSGMDPGPDL